MIWDMRRDIHGGREAYRYGGSIVSSSEWTVPLLITACGSDQQEIGRQGGAASVRFGIWSDKC